MKFRTILADPPWRYEHSRTEDRSIEAHYNTMSIDDICTLPVREISDDSCVLLMWCTWPKMEEGLRVVNSWGFKAVSGFPWIKMHSAGTPRIGMGYYTRSVSEYVIVGTRGTGNTPITADRLPGVIFCPRGDHSAKPDMQYEFGESFACPRLEMFARNHDGGLFPPREGWTRIGNDITGRDIAEDIAILSAKTGD